MTGFGQARFENKELNLMASVKSVNGRFLEIKFFLPKEYAQIENRLREVIRSEVDRGTMDVYVKRQFVSKGSNLIVEPLPEVAKQWLKAEEKLASSLKIARVAPDLNRLFHRPEVFRVVESHGLREGEEQQAVKLVQAALRAWKKESLREGKALKMELEKLTAAMMKSVESMKNLVASARDFHLKKLEQKMQRLLGDQQIDRQRLIQEAAMLADKGDISEELARLKEHLIVTKKMLTEKGPVGKKLDFYTQELLRESNTIGSKSQTSELTEKVVHVKSLIEKMKEQVQNIQ